MSRKVLISLVGKEAAPNVNFIKQHNAEVDYYIFVSSPESEGNNYTKSILDSCRIKENFVILQSDANLFDSTFNLLEGLEFSKDDIFIVNLTGGTKMMALGIWRFFTQKGFSQRSKIFYLPIGKDEYFQIYPENQIQMLDTNISVKDYLIGYSLKVLSTSEPLKPKEYTFDMMSNILENTQHISDSLMEKLQNYRSSKKITISAIDELSEYLNRINFTTEKENELNQKEIKYLTGTCFEEWTYHKLKDFLKEQNKTFDIAFSVNIEQFAQNDFDVIVVYKNQIFVIECKTFISEQILKDTTLYKSGSLKSKFGLSVKSFLFTLSNLRNTEGNFKPAIEKRAKSEGVVLADKNVLWETESLKKFLEEHLS